MSVIESEIFSQIVKKRTLPHPTARNFDAAQWRMAGSNLVNPTERDIQLLAAGLYYGNEIKQLRDRFEKLLFERIDKPTGILLTVAVANLTFRIFDRKAKKSARKRARENKVTELAAIGRQPVASSYSGNQADPDAGIAAIVDTIPHCLERAFQQKGTKLELSEFHQAAHVFFRSYQSNTASAIYGSKYCGTAGSSLVILTTQRPLDTIQQIAN
jgi:hypothetical protein